MTRRCDMPVAGIRMCSRPARYLYYGSDGYVVKGYCAQHYRTAGYGRILRPRPWEYVRVWDDSAKINEEAREGIS